MKKFLSKYLPTKAEMIAVGIEAWKLLKALRWLGIGILAIQIFSLWGAKEIGDAEMIGTAWRAALIAVLLALPKLQARWPQIKLSQIAALVAIIVLALVHLFNLDQAILKLIPKVGIWPILIGAGILVYVLKRRKNPPTP